MTNGDQRLVFTPASLNRLGNWQVNTGQPWAGVANHREALALLETQGDRRASDLSTAGHDPRQSLPDPTVTWITGNVTVTNNILANSLGNAVLAVEDYSHWHSAEQMGITLTGNVYQRTSAGSPTWLIVWSRGAGDPAVFNSLAQFTAATGQDRTSRSFDGQDVLSAGFAPLPLVTSLTSALAQPLPAATAALTGEPAGSLRIGAWN